MEIDAKTADKKIMFESDRLELRPPDKAVLSGEVFVDDEKIEGPAFVRGLGRFRKIIDSTDSALLVDWIGDLGLIEIIPKKTMTCSLLPRKAEFICRGV